MPDTNVITVRYYGSLPEYYGYIGCATMEGEWSGPDTTRYTVVLWDGRGVLHHVRRRSIETGGVTVYEGATCGCGANHDRSPMR